MGDRGSGEDVIIRALSLPFTQNLFPRSREPRVAVHSRNRLNRYRPRAIMRAKCPIEVNNVRHNGNGAYMTGARGERRLRESVTTSPFSFTIILTFIYRIVYSRNTRGSRREAANAKIASTIIKTRDRYRLNNYKMSLNRALRYVTLRRRIDMKFTLEN